MRRHRFLRPPLAGLLYDTMRIRLSVNAQALKTINVQDYSIVRDCVGNP